MSNSNTSMSDVSHGGADGLPAVGDEYIGLKYDAHFMSHGGAVGDALTNDVIFTSHGGVDIPADVGMCFALNGVADIALHRGADAQNGIVLENMERSFSGFDGATVYRLGSFAFLVS